MILNHISRIYRNEATENGEPGGAPTPAMNRRYSAEEQIAARVQEAQAGDFVGFNEATGEIDAPKAAATPAVEVVEETPAETPAEVVAAPAVQAPRLVPIVVDGETIEVEESRLIEAGRRTLQKESAADRRLMEANEILNRARAHERASQDPAQSNQTTNQAPSQDALQTTQPTTNGLDPAMLDTYLENKLYMRDAIKAAAKFDEDFPEIAADPYLKSLAANEENKRLNTAAALGESFGDPYAAYKKHGETIRKWLQERTGATPGAALDKTAVKRTITAVSAVNAKAPTKQEPRAQTPSEIIEEERKARAGRSLVKH